MVGVEVAHHQGVAAEVLLEKGSEAGGVARWAAGCGGDVEVNDGYFDVLYCDDDTLMFGGIIVGEEGVGVEGEVGCVLPNEEGQPPSPVCTGSVTSDGGEVLEVDGVGLGSQFGLLDAGHADFVGSEELLELVPRIPDAIAKAR